LIKTTLGQLHAAVPALTALMGEKLPIPVAVKVSLLAKRINPEMATFGEHRQSLFMEYGKPAEDDPATIKVPDDKMAEFTPKMNELLGTEVELQLDPVKLEAIAGASLTAIDIGVLMDAGLVAE
jgi:hypothetical protein